MTFFSRCSLRGELACGPVIEVLQRCNRLTQSCARPSGSHEHAQELEPKSSPRSATLFNMPTLNKPALFVTQTFGCEERESCPGLVVFLTLVVTCFAVTMLSMEKDPLFPVL